MTATSVNIQFHMLYDELVEFVVMICDRYGMTVEIERYSPRRRVTRLDASTLAAKLRDFGHVDCFWLVYRTGVSGKAEKFMLAVGGTRGARLAQSQFGARTTKVGASRVLRGVARELRKCTTGGLWMVTEMGNIGFVKSFRVSKGAAQASKEGRLLLVGVTFTQSFHVDPNGLQDWVTRNSQ